MVVVGDISFRGVVAQCLGFGDTEVSELLLQSFDVVTGLLSHAPVAAGLLGHSDGKLLEPAM
jgi:hypothetical protein